MKNRQFLLKLLELFFVWFRLEKRAPPRKVGFKKFCYFNFWLPLDAPWYRSPWYWRHYLSASLHNCKVVAEGVVGWRMGEGDVCKFINYITLKILRLKISRCHQIWRGFASARSVPGVSSKNILWMTVKRTWMKKQLKLVTAATTVTLDLKMVEYMQISVDLSRVMRNA